MNSKMSVEYGLTNALLNSKYPVSWLCDCGKSSTVFLWLVAIGNLFICFFGFVFDMVAYRQKAKRFWASLVGIIDLMLESFWGLRSGV